MKRPLEQDLFPPQKVPSTPQNSSVGTHLELLPIFLLSGGLLAYQFGFSHWKTLILFGGGASILLYALYATLSFHKGNYSFYELSIAILSASCFPLGVSGILYPDVPLLTIISQLAFQGCLILFLFAFVFLLFNIKNESTSRFYRALLTRIMLITLVLLILMV